MIRRQLNLPVEQCRVLVKARVIDDHTWAHFYRHKWTTDSKQRGLYMVLSSNWTFYHHMCILT